MVGVSVGFAVRLVGTGISVVGCSEGMLRKEEKLVEFDVPFGLIEEERKEVVSLFLPAQSR